MDAQGFENIIRFHHPHKWMAKDYSFITNEELMFAMDTHGECQLPLHDKHKLASHILNITHACVIKDIDGLFNNGMTASATNFTIDWSMMVDDPKDGISPHSNPIPKCICGSRSVGSNKHSNYCEIKEGA